MVMPSTTVAGSLSRMPRSLNAPGSPSSQLQRMYLLGSGLPARNPHLTPAGKAAPRAPRRPDVRTSPRVSSGVISVRALFSAGVAAVGDVLVQVGGVDVARIAQSDTLLQRHHGVVVQVGNAVRRRVAVAIAQVIRSVCLGHRRAPPAICWLTMRWAISGVTRW